MATKETKKKSNNTNAAKSEKTAAKNKSNDLAKEKFDKAKAEHNAQRGVIDNIWGIIFIAIGIFLFAAVEFQAAGQLGNVIGGWMKGVFGLVGIILPFYLILFGILLLAKRAVHISWLTVLLGAVILLMLCLINAGRFIESSNIFFSPSKFYEDGKTLAGGGFFGMMVGMFLVKYIGKVGLYGVACAAIFVCLLLIINTPVSRGIDAIKDWFTLRRLRKQAEREEEEEYYRLKQEEKEKLQNEALAKDREERERKRQLTLNDLTQENKDQPEISSTVDLFAPVVSEETAEKTEKPSEEEEKPIIKIMKDSTIFDKEEEIEGMGLQSEEENQGASVPHSEPTTYGIDPERKVKPGYGLDGDTSISSGLGLEPMSEKGITRESKSSATVNTYNPEEGDKHEPAPTLSNKEAKVARLTDKDFSKTRKIHRYKKPPIDLLKQISRSDDSASMNAELEKRARTLEETLRNFNVDAKVVQVTQGPAVTRYEIQPNVGVKVAKIVSLADDIALNLRAKSIRIEAPIPGKAAVGIEVENEKINMVTLREIIDSREFKQSKSKITFAVGRDIAGKAIVADLKTMPHLLIAGSTGSGKSVCINGIITSILYKADPEEVKLVLIDPKVVELGNYNGIPHLLIPVVVDPNKAAAALNWAVAEMTDRYKKFAEAGVRDLESYNEYVDRTLREMKHVKEDYDTRSDGLAPEKPEKLPQIVIIIDELADLMMAAPTQVEESICRLAQLARAAGMHLIVATQRPSVDVITGVIKANIPSRIAFAVASQHDSRTILDKMGAEKLVGKGDMLYNPLGQGKSIRVQGCFISDDEIHDVIQYVKSQVEDVEYSPEVVDVVERGEVSGSDGDDKDELLPEAIQFAVLSGQCSTSKLQRRFRIGYNRAANMVDAMEARGILGPPDGSKPRQVLITEEEYENMKNNL